MSFITLHRTLSALNGSIFHGRIAHQLKIQTYVRQVMVKPINIHNPIELFCKNVQRFHSISLPLHIFGMDSRSVMPHFVYREYLFNPSYTLTGGRFYTNVNRSSEVTPKVGRERAVRRLKSRIFNIRTFINTKKQNFTKYKVNRRQKLNEMKQKFIEKSIAVSLGCFQLFYIFSLVQVEGSINPKDLWEIRRHYIFNVSFKHAYFISHIISVYVTTLGLMSCIVFCGYLTSEELNKWLKYTNITSFNVPDMGGPFAKFTLAYIATKILEPIRLIVSIIITVITSKLFKK